jgi:hypothetical protein
VGEGDLPTTQWAMTHARDAASALLGTASIMAVAGRVGKRSR